MDEHALLPGNWNAKQAGDQVPAGLTNVCLSRVKGAHDSDLCIVDGKAYSDPSHPQLPRACWQRSPSITERVPQSRTIWR